MASNGDMDLNKAREEKDSALDEEEEEEDEESLDDEYIVEAIRDWRYNLREKTREYLIKWKGYDETENTWEPEDHLSCPDILEKYIDSLSSRRYRYWSSEAPENLSGFKRNATYKSCIGADGPHDSDSEDSEYKKNKQKFYCLILFEDSEFAEEVTLKEFMQHKPQEAWNFLESRMYFKSKHHQ